ncbi:MAG: benzoate-CoA ligase family protein [Myxococcaceae bacterium]|nr:benzoate-CoA ligase family protein [Myxococcaceae bacterium]
MNLDHRNLPEQLNIAEVFLYRQLPRRAKAPALIHDGGVVTYEALADQTNRATAVYKSLGLEMEQRVLLMLPDVPQFASAWLAAVKAGGVVSAVSPDQQPDDVVYYLNYTRSKILVAHASNLAAVNAALPRCPHVRAVLVVGMGQAEGDTTPGARPTVLDYDAELARATPDPSFAPTHRDDPAVWLYTSGSTGFPKAATHKHHDFVYNALTYGLPIVGYNENDICLSAPKLAFGYALGSNLLFPLMAGACSVIFPEKPTPERLIELVRKHRPTMLTCVPTVLNAIANHPAAKEVDWSSVRVCISAGEALPAEIYNKWKSVTGVEILDGIGSAEMFHIFITNRLGDVKLGSLGRVVEGYEAKICDDDGRELPRGEIGTLWIRGDSMALEYWQQHEKSKQTFRGDWCVSADKFYQDEGGYFYFCGRGDDMLKVNGKWLSPVEVENALLKHPAVREAAVIGFKDADGLEKPKAFVVLNEGHTPGEALAEALKAHAREVLTPFKAPRQVVFVDALPKSDRGKVLKSQLRG